MINSITIIVIVVSLFLCGIFYWLIRPLFKYLSRTSHNMREAVLPGLLELNKTIITICSAAIILTITLIDKSVIGKNYLMASWFALITCIGVGILILLTSYVERVVVRVFIKEFSDYSKEKKNTAKNKKDSKGEEVSKAFKYYGLLNKALVVLIYLLVSSLFISFLFMIIFGVKNL